MPHETQFPPPFHPANRSFYREAYREMSEAFERAWTATDELDDLQVIDPASLDRYFALRDEEVAALMEAVDAMRTVVYEVRQYFTPERLAELAEFGVLLRQSPIGGASDPDPEKAQAFVEQFLAGGPDQALAVAEQVATEMRDRFGPASKEAIKFLHPNAHLPVSTFLTAPTSSLIN